MIICKYQCIRQLDKCWIGGYNIGEGMTGAVMTNEGDGILADGEARVFLHMGVVMNLSV